MAAGFDTTKHRDGALAGLKHVNFKLDGANLDGVRGWESVEYPAA